MFVVLSPAKSLNLDEVEPPLAPTQPELLDDARKLATTCRNLSQSKLRELMGISKDLAKLNAGRFAAWQLDHHPGNSKPAALMFAGDTYRGLQASGFDAEDWAFAQEHVGLLSGLYGLLRPLDLIQPYRLEMGSRLKTRRGEDLYDYWRDTIRKAVQRRLDGHADPTVVCCASNEYFAAVQPKKLETSVLTCAFYERRGDDRKMISFFAKQARGAMARWVVKNRAERREQLQGFDWEGYRFDPATSDDATYVFEREG